MMNMLEMAQTIAGMTLKIELAESTEAKIDEVVKELREVTDKAVEKLDYRWKVTQLLIVIGLLGNLIIALV